MIYSAETSRAYAMKNTSIGKLIETELENAIQTGQFSFEISTSSYDHASITAASKELQDKGYVVVCNEYTETLFVSFA